MQHALAEAKRLEHETPDQAAQRQAQTAVSHRKSPWIQQLLWQEQGGCIFDHQLFKPTLRGVFRKHATFKGVLEKYSSEQQYICFCLSAVYLISRAFLQQEYISYK